MNQIRLIEDQHIKTSGQVITLARFCPTTSYRLGERLREARQQYMRRRITATDFKENMEEIMEEAKQTLQRQWGSSPEQPTSVTKILAPWKAGDQ